MEFKRDYKLVTLQREYNIPPNQVWRRGSYAFACCINNTTEWNLQEKPESKAFGKGELLKDFVFVDMLYTPNIEVE